MNFRVMLTALVLSVPLAPAHGQYFGRNKVVFDKFDFRILETPQFRVHFYPQEEVPARDMARAAERWNGRLSSLFGHTLSERKSIIFYASHADFQQTNVIQQTLTESTGGVTEGLRTRLIMPLTGIYRDNDHVLGHELVHVFQYNLSESKGGGGLTGLSSLPLWVIEGIAEYFSVGRADSHTAMWMRDAVIRKDLPSIAQLSSSGKYFPYRYGQALWAYVGGVYGDQAVANLFREATKSGFERAIVKTLLTTSDSLSRQWHAASRAAYAPAIAGRTAASATGTVVLPVKRRGDMSVSPVISPDGSRVAFFSSRGLFGVDLFMADTRTGRTIQKLASVTTNSEVDELSFVNSAGSWSPDGRKFAFVAFTKGDNELGIVDVATRKTARRFKIPGVDEFTNPAWSPDGKTIALSGLSNGVSDLYVFDMQSGETRQLTNDRYADLQPSWSPDGRSIAFVTDRGEGTNFTTLQYAMPRLGIIDAASGSIQLLPAFRNAKHINPQYAPDGRSIYFVSDADGVSDIYRFTPATNAIARVTRLETGVSGITYLSPAISVSSATGQIAFSVFTNQGYAVHTLPSASVLPGDVPAFGSGVAQGATTGAGTLPPFAAQQNSVVARYLDNPEAGLATSGDFSVSPYKSTITLAAFGDPSLAVGSNGFGGTGVAGGVSAYFTDMLGDQSILAVVNASGEIRDIGGQVVYQNTRRRWAWSVGATHSPYLSGFASARPVQVNLGGTPVVGRLVEQYKQRVFLDQGQASLHYPFSTTRRFEFNTSVTRLSYSTRVERYIEVNGEQFERMSRDTTSLPGVSYGTAAVAMAGDASFSGFTSPVLGWRYRFEYSPTVGEVNYQGALADYRRYFFASPVTFAIRGLHYGRYGKDAESDLLTPIFIGDPSLIRGYSLESFNPDECSAPTTGTNGSNGCPEFDRLVGSRIAIASAELRIPILGTEQLGLIRSPLPLELSPFVDAGVAWTASQSPDFLLTTRSVRRVPVVSAGVSARVNLFGYAVIEAYYAKPFQRPNREGGIFGFQLQPGW